MIGLPIMLVSVPAVAQSNADIDPTRESHVSVAVTGGTLGVGPEVGFRISDHIGIRGSGTFLGFNAGFSSDDIEYDGSLKLKSFGAMVDLYPMGGHFRLSAGARINKNNAGVTATPTGTVEVGDDSYSASQVGTLRGRAEVNDFAPALTLGWSGANRRGFMIGFDAGVLFQGSAKIQQFTATGSLANNSAFQASLEKERIDLQNDVNGYKLYPIAQFSIGYRF